MTEKVTLAIGPKAFRDKLPCPRPTNFTGLLSVLKSAIGKDITRISMPVQFNEPLSFLQRLCEDLEYSDLLDKAAGLLIYRGKPSWCQLAMPPCIVWSWWLPSATACSHLWPQVNGLFVPCSEGQRKQRTYKSFNPLLGETYEYVHPDKGYRVICEQVEIYNSGVSLPIRSAIILL